MTAPVTNLVIESALRGLLFAAVVGAGLSVLRVRHIPTQKAAWTLVLIASLAMPFLMRSPLLAGWQGKLAWAVPIRISAAVAPPAAVTAVVAQPVVESAGQEPAPQVETMRADLPAVEPADAAVLAPVADSPAAVSAPARRFSWPAIGRMMVWLYFAVAGALLLRLLFGLFSALRLWLTAEPVSPLVAPDGNVRASRRIPSPVTVGSGIVLPADYPQWEQSRLRMVLAHERSHVRQMDFWLQLLAGLYAAAFWFSPLGWWLRRQLAHLGEAMSDRAGMDAASSGSDYAQVILQFASVPRRRLPGVAMASTGNLSRRIDALLNESRFRRAFAEGRRRALASLLLIPAALFAATVLIRVPAASAQTAPAGSGPRGAPSGGPSGSGPSQAAPTGGPAGSGPTQPAPAAAPAGSGPVQAAPQAVPPPPSDPAAPMTPPDSGQTVVPPAAPPLPPAIGEGQGYGSGEGQSSRGSESTTISRSGSSDFAYHRLPDGNAWAIASGTWSSDNLPESLSASRRAELEHAHQTANGPFLWFTHDGKSYVVTDPEVVAQLVRHFQAVGDLGEQQRLLGQTQENLGKQMQQMARLQKEAAGTEIPNLEQLMPQIEKSLQDAEKQMQMGPGPQQMAQLQAELQKDLSPEKMAAIQAELKSAEAQLTPERMAKIQAALKLDLSPEKMAEINAQMKAAEAQWNAEGIAKMQERLAEAQARLGEAQAELNARQGEYSVRMGNLGQKMGTLGQQQGRLGAEQKRLSHELNERVQQAIQQALQNGTAHVVQ